uniref:Uncharacterized protein n=1 Tax=Arundo donax TaxID=35708 RepID=A0A0A9BPU0_ARUDO
MNSSRDGSQRCECWHTVLRM